MTKAEKFKSGKGIKSPTRIPNFILKFKGKRDSKKGRIRLKQC